MTFFVIRLWSLRLALCFSLLIADGVFGIREEGLESKLQPSRGRRACLEALHPMSMLIERRTVAVPGLRGWLALLCAPSASITLCTFWRTVFPGEGGLLDDGHSPEALPGKAHRFMLALKRLGQTARLIGYQFSCLLRRQERPSRRLRGSG